jgi:DNA-directed RNA polymerase specialized sigma24 family protein
MDGELASRIEQAMAQLSTKLRAALVLTAIERLPAGEAAAIEGCSAATMHWRVHQARKQLKQHLQGYLKS